MQKLGRSTLSMPQKCKLIISSLQSSQPTDEAHFNSLRVQSGSLSHFRSWPQVRWGQQSRQTDKVLWFLVSAISSPLFTTVGIKIFSDDSTPPPPIHLHLLCWFQDTYRCITIFKDDYLMSNSVNSVLCKIKKESVKYNRISNISSFACFSAAFPYSQ